MQQVMWWGQFRADVVVKDAENQKMKDEWTGSQPKKGNAACCILHLPVQLNFGSTTEESLSSDQQKFILNPTVDTLPHNCSLEEKCKSELPIVQ